MLMKMKKIIAATAACSLALSPMAAMAETQNVNAVQIEDPSVLGTTDRAPAGKSASSEPTSSDMERLIKLVKPKLGIPEECDNFNWHYTAPDYARAAEWRFDWSDKEYKTSVHVSCDENGNITSYSINRSDRSARGFKMPEFTKEALAANAATALEKLCPEAAGSFRLSASQSGGLYSQSFRYTFTRYENGVIVPDDTATVSVDYTTGELLSFDCRFHYGLDFGAAAAIDSEEAKKLLSEKQTMKLSYRLKTEFDDEGNFTGRKAYLVYTPEIPYLSADAESGEIYTERNTWQVVTSGGGSDGMANSKADLSTSPEAGREYELSEKELAQLDVLDGLISKKEAVDSVLDNSALYIESAATAVDARLIKRGSSARPYYPIAAENAHQAEERYVWSIRFSAPYEQSVKENGYYSAYMNAVVDAESGELLSFHTSVPDYGYYINDYKNETPPELTITADAARGIFRDFAEQQIPAIMAQTRLSDENGSVVIGYEKTADSAVPLVPVYRCTRVNFVRVNEGVDFPYNTVSGAVDRVTGKVTDYGYDWYDDVVFESPADAMTPESAYRILLDSEGFGLNYEINSDYTYKQYLADSVSAQVMDIGELYETKQYTRLVYSGYAYDSTTVSALSGELLGYSGEPYERKEDYVYDDLDGHWAEADIRMLTDLGFGFEGSSFRPDAAITEAEYLQLLRFFGKTPVDSNPETPSDAAITRTQAVKTVIDAAGYYKIAGMPDIFVTDFADNSELRREDVGFIAIARGLGLVQGDAAHFRPYDDITRAEAVTLIVNFLKLSE